MLKFTQQKRGNTKMTSPAVATQKDFKAFLANQFWGENLLENYVMYSTPGSRICGLPTLNMSLFIPMALIQGCLLYVSETISAHKKVDNASLNASLPTSVDCFKRIGHVFMQYITLSTPEHSDFWPHFERFNIENFTTFVFPSAVDNSLLNRVIYNACSGSVINNWTYKPLVYFAYATNSHLLFGSHSMSRFDTALPLEEFYDEVIVNDPKVVGENIETSDGRHCLNKITSPGRVSIITIACGTKLSNSPAHPSWPNVVIQQINLPSNKLYTPSVSTLETTEKTLSGRFNEFKCYNNSRLDEIKPYLSPSQRKLIYNMIHGKLFVIP